MIRFLIYLFESGLCLSLLFLVYYLFLRKETYFTFNRFYLLSILVLSLLFPLVHLQFSKAESPIIESQVKEIERVKGFYERLIALSDPDYNANVSKAFRKEEALIDESSGTAFSPEEELKSNKNIRNDSTPYRIDSNNTFNVSRAILLLYLSGMLFFTGRLVLLLLWIRQTIKKYGFTVEGGIKMVRMDDEVPPFSFFRFVFLHRETVSHSGLGQIISHEKVHISQRHSLDLLLAHALTVFQWFNPFVWFINNAMKTNHEYIADRKVINQGYELFDYQSLLLKQIISIRSVELVNNFNLINIKKRIAMMTKIKSGITAQLKALVVIPAAIFLFFFFADVTFAQESVGFNNKDYSNEIQGFWKNTDTQAYGTLLNFSKDNFQILEDYDTYREFKFEFKKSSHGIDKKTYQESSVSKITPSPKELAAVYLNYGKGIPTFRYIHLNKDELKISWTPKLAGTYKRIDVPNSTEMFAKLEGEDFNGVSTSFYRILENPDKAYFLVMDKDGNMLLNGKKLSSLSIKDEIKKVKYADKPFEAEEKFPVFVIDGRCEMAYVNVLYRKLREIDELRHAISVIPRDMNVPEVFYHHVGIPRLLPPKDAETFNEENFKKSGVKVINIDLSLEDLTPEAAAVTFDREIQKDQKYVVLYQYRHETTFNRYMSILDEFYQAVHRKRDGLAKEKYNLPYDDLAKVQQKEILRSYPRVLTERNLDWVDYK